MTASSRRRRISWLAVLVTSLAAGCLLPTDDDGYFGELRVRPGYSAGEDPADIDADIDSSRTIVRRVDAGGTVALDEVRTSTGTDTATWVVDIETEDETVEVELELRSAGSVLYRGGTEVLVSSGSIGHSPTSDVPVRYVGPALARRVVVQPASVALTRVGDSRALRATAYDAADAVIPDKAITWTSRDETIATVNDGVATAAGYGSTFVVASADGVTDTATVIVDSTLVRTTTITADSTSLPSDGTSSSQVTVEVLDASGNPVGASAGPVTLSATLDSIGPVTDHGNGTYTAIFTAGTTAGTAVITGTLDGDSIADSATIALTPLDPDVTTTTITAVPDTLPADGSAMAQVTVAVRDSSGNPVGSSAGTVTLAASMDSIGPVTDQGDGTYMATFFAGTTAGDAVISGTLNGSPIADTDTVTLTAGPPSPTTTTITAVPDTLPADGSATAQVTVAVRDSSGNPVGSSAGTVTLAASMDSIGPVTDQGDGTYMATFFAGTTAGDAVISGTLNGSPIADTDTVTLRAEPDPTTTTIEADPTEIRTGDSIGAAIAALGAVIQVPDTSVVTVTVRDAAGIPLGRSPGTVTLFTTLGTLGPVEDHGDGTYTATLYAGPASGTAYITGTLNGTPVADEAKVRIVEP